MKYLIVLSLLLLVAGHGVNAQKNPQKNVDNLTIAQWREDLMQISSTIKKKHLNPFYAISEETFDQKVKEVYKRIPQMKPYQIRTEFVKIGAMIGDGHTNVKAYRTFQRYPIRFYWMEGKLWVMGYATEGKNKDTYFFGWYVTAIDDMPIAKAEQLVNQLTASKENKYFMKGWSAYWFTSKEALHALGIAKKLNKIKYTLENNQGELFTLKLPLHLPKQTNKWIWAYHPKLEFWKKDQNRLIWYKLYDKNTVYVRWHGYTRWGKVRKITREIIKQAKQHKMRKFIIDFRGNGGGNYNKGLHLIKKLKKNKLIEHIQFYALTDRGTYSAAMSNASHFKQYCNALLVGEPSGQKPNSYSETSTYVLKHSRVRCSASIRYYVFQKGDDGPILKLDKTILPRYEDFNTGKDRVLEWVLAQD